MNSESINAKLWIIAGGAFLLLLHMHHYYPSMPDDAFISLRYAQRLAEGHGLTWNDGERVEGYSNPLWVLLAALMYDAGMDTVKAVCWLGAASAVATLGVFYYHARKTGLPAIPFAIGIMAFAMTGPVAIWGISGMETPLLMLLFGWAVVVSRELLYQENVKSSIMAGIMLGLICWLRPEGPLYTLAMAAALLVHSAVPLNRRIRMIAFICIIPLCFFSTLLAFRLYYYGAWVPNSVLAKVTFNFDRFIYGISYVSKAALSFLPLLILIHYLNKKYHGVTGDPSQRFRRFMLSVFLLLTMAIVSAGGDWFFSYRAFVPLVPLVVLGVMEACRTADVGREQLFIASILLVYIFIQRVDHDNVIAKIAQNWIEEIPGNMGRELKKKYGDTQPLVAVYAAGAIPFYSQLPSLDMYGLNDAYLTAHRKEIRNFGSKVGGHDLFDVQYIESRKPDILVLDVPKIEPFCTEWPKECVVLLRNYTQVTLKIPGYDVPIWLRRDSKKVAVPKRPD